MRTLGPGELRELTSSPNAICRECALGNGAEAPAGHVCTFWEAVCRVCGHKKAVSCVSDWNWPKVLGPKMPREV